MVLSHSMKQGLFLLSLNVLELEEYLENEIDQNPFLTKISSTNTHSFLEIPANASRFTHLMNQAKLVFTKNDLLIATNIIGNLDEKGFYPHEMTSDCKKKILKTIQTFDPIGIAAYNRQESLLIQLKSLGKINSLAYRIIKDFYTEFLHKKWDQILKKSECTQKDLFTAIFSEIARLNFSPGQGFDKSHNPINIPDLIIEKKREAYQALVCDPVSFKVKDPYSSYTTKETSTWKIQQLRSISSLMKYLENRKSLLTKIGAILIEYELEFFEGTEALQPISMKEIATRCNVHLTTIHRAIYKKYVKCSKGIFPLSIFFKKSVKTNLGKEVSNQAILEKIQTMIQKENKKKPLSDEVIVKKLQLQGLQIARRTITKYRKTLKIPAAFYRKSTI